MVEFLLNVSEELFTAFIIAAPTGWLSATWALKKSRTEKWWDKKLSFYLDTLSALNNLILYCDSAIDVEHEEVNYSDDQLAEILEKFHEARFFLQAQVNISQLLYGEAISLSLVELNNGLFVAERRGEHIQRVADIRELAESCISVVVTNAKSDLGVK